MHISQEILSQLVFTFSFTVVSIVISLVLHRLVDLLFDQMRGHLTGKKFISKTYTLKSLIKNLLDAALFSMTIFIILAHWGINIMPLLTGAGLIGLAISFGSQTLVKDIISGFFIILEDQYNVGDTVVIIDKYKGVVESITLRLTVLRDKDGSLLYIPNSQITIVKQLKSQA